MKVLSHRSLRLIHLLPFLCHEVAANTEIISFSSSREPTVDLPWAVVGNWSTLHPTDNERRWSLEPAALHTPLHRVCEPAEEDAGLTPPPFSCPHELWFLLDLDDDKWASYSTFTLRLSWAASTPADFTIALYTPQDVLARLSDHALRSNDGSERRAQTPYARAGGGFPHASASSITTATAAAVVTRTSTTRSRYARVRAVHAGVPTPGSRSHPSPPPHVPAPHRAHAPSHPHSHSHSHPHPHSHSRPAAAAPAGDSSARTRDAPPARGDGEEPAGRVPLVVILEPAYWGVLPATLLPTVGILIPVLLAAVSVVPWVSAYLDPFVRQAREDMNTEANKGR